MVDSPEDKRRTELNASSNASALEASNDNRTDQAPNIKRLGIEEAFHLSGAFGRFNFTSSAINTIVNGACMLFFNSFSFIEVEPQFMCKLDGPLGPWTYQNEDNAEAFKKDYCDNLYNCEINYADPSTVKNLIIQLNFECAPGWQLGLVGSLFLIGIVVGCSFVTKWGDTYGRRPVYAAGLMMNAVFVLICIFSKIVLLTYVCLFMLGISITARYYVGYTYNVEFQLKRDKVIVSTVQFMMESVVYLLDIIYFLYISKEWVWLQIPNIILCLVGVTWVMLLPETPRYLLAKKRWDDARDCFKKMAKWNGCENPEIWDEVRFEKEAEEMENPDLVRQLEEEEKQAPVMTAKDIWAIPVLRTNLWSAALLYVEATFNFYLLTFYLKYFPGNIFQNSVYFACSDLCAFFGAGLMLKYLGMKTSIRIAASIALTGGISYLFLSQNEDLIPIIICFSRVGQSMIFNTTLICVNKLFPTLFIASAYGIVNFCAHTVACLSPFIAEIKNPYPFSFFCCFVLCAIFSSFFLTEIDDQMSLEDLGKQEAPTFDKIRKESQTGKIEDEDAEETVAFKKEF